MVLELLGRIPPQFLPAGAVREALYSPGTAGLLEPILPACKELKRASTGRAPVSGQAACLHSAEQQN